MRFFGNDLGFASVEFQTPVAGLSFFATSANGDNGYDHVGRSPLLLRQSQAPEAETPWTMNNITETALWTLGTYGAEYNRRAHAFEPAAGASGWTGSIRARYPRHRVTAMPC